MCNLTTSLTQCFKLLRFFKQLFHFRRPTNVVLSVLITVTLISELEVDLIINLQ